MILLMLSFAKKINTLFIVLPHSDFYNLYVILILQ